MDSIPIILAILTGLIISLTLVSAFSGRITVVLQRHYPYSADYLDLLLLGVSIAVATLAFGLMIVYLFWYF
jgi:hypothetical protein